MDIREIILEIIKDKVKNPYGIICEVTSVSGTTCNCSPVDDSADIEGVRLQTQASSGILLVPAVGSKVVVQMVNDVEGVVIMYSAVDSIRMLDGSFGGLIKIDGLVSKLNNVENKVNDLITYLLSVTSGGNPLSPLFSGGSLTPTNVSEIENEKITHGTV